MTKAVSFSFGFLFLFTFCATSPAQPAATDFAVEQAILNQHDTIVLRQKLVEAHAAVEHGDLPGAAKLYEDAKALVDRIGSGIDAEATQTIAGLVAVRMELAKQAQRNGDYMEADTEITRVLKVDPANPDAQAFKRDNDAILASMKGKMPSPAALAKIPMINADKTAAGTDVQDGKLLYEMGKFEEAEVKLNEALKLDPDNQAAFYYLNLVKQAFYARQEHKRVTEAQDKMVEVEKQWSPKSGINLPVPNPYATNRNVHTGIGREMIYSKLDRLRLDNVSWPEGLPLSEALHYLTDQSKLRDPDKKGINFLFNPNQESEAGAPTDLNNPAPVRIDPATGNPIPGVAAGPGAGAEPIDPSTINVKLTLSDVSLHDAIDAIILVADKRIRYSVQDWGVIFAVKPAGPEPPQLEMRVFKVDPNTFYQGLESVTSFTFGSANNNNGGNGGGGNSGGGGNNGGGGGGGQNGGQNGNISGAIVPVVDVAGGGRNGGNGGGGRGNNGGQNGGGTTGGGGGGSGLSYITSVGNMQDVSVAAKTFFQAIGVDLTTPGRSLAFNDRLGLLFVKATGSELDAIERTIQTLNQVAPQVHVKARFIEVSQDDSAALGFDWYLGNFINGRVIANGGSAPPLTVPVSAANPLGTFPGNTVDAVASAFAQNSNPQLLTQGLRNTGPALATVTGILTDPNFRVVMHALEQRGGVETLAEPEVVTTSGRQTQMRATEIQYILTGFNFQQGNNNVNTGNGNP
jgi:tetratricopeptide (TPR) repeat protein